MKGFMALDRAGPGMRLHSLRHRLPLLIFALLAAIGAAFAWMAYREVEQALRASGIERAASAASQVSELLAQSVASRPAEARRIAANPEVRDAVRSRTLPTGSAMPAVLRDFVSRNQQATVWFYDASGNPIGPLTKATVDGSHPPPLDAAPAAVLPEGISRLRVHDGRVSYFVTVGVASEGEGTPRAGYLSIQRSLRSAAGAGLIERLIGAGAVIKLGNATGDVWTDLSSPVAAPPHSTSARPARYVSDGQLRLGASSPVSGTPWLVWADISEASVLAPVHLLAKRMVPVSLLITILGAFAVYVACARVTKPLEQLAEAAQAVAAGDYSRRVDIARHDEIGRLGLAFNVMAARVAKSHDASEERVVERTTQLAQANAFLDSIVENLPDMVFVKDARDLRFVRVNRAGEEMLGLSRAELIGRSDAELFPAELAGLFTAADRQALAAQTVVEIVEDVIETPSRGSRVLHTKKIPIVSAASGEPEYLLGISRDITDRKAADEAVRLAKLEAERASRAKSEFLSRMSHDLRTPLNAILGFAQLLDMDGLAPEQSESVRQILKGGRHLLDLINEVLDIARIEAGQLSLSPEPVAVSDVVAQVTDLVRPLGASRGITVTAPLSGDASTLHVHADRQRLTQVLMNLVANAVKYNRGGGSVRVSCVAKAEQVRLTVTDTGAGIPPEKLALLFQPFERLGADQRAIEGTGLGLAVSKGLTEAMGGTIGVESVIDEGSTFWVELPRSHVVAAPEWSVPSPHGARPEAVTGTVLYIEDNRSNIRLLERLLTRRRGVRLLTSSSGEEGVAIARAEHPDLILLDLHLPDVRGEEVLRRLWASPITRGIPVAVLSADATTRQSERLLAAGAVAYLTKPLELTRLLKLLDDTLPTAGAVITRRHPDGA